MKTKIIATIFAALMFTAVTYSSEMNAAETKQKFTEAKKLYDAKKYKAAFPLMNSAAKHGHAAAQMHLGKMYYNGWGVKHNHATGRKWHKKAAAQGNKESIEKLKTNKH